MKAPRFWIVVMLVVLLPLRSALAAAMLCPPAAAEREHGVTRMHAHDPAHSAKHDDAQVHGHVQGPAHGHEHAHEPGHAHELAHAHESVHAHEAGPAHDAGGQDRCHLCAAFCSLTPLPSRASDLATVELAEAPPPGLAAPAPSFLSGGLERPPRSH